MNWKWIGQNFQNLRKNNENVPPYYIYFTKVMDALFDSWFSCQSQINRMVLTSIVTAIGKNLSTPIHVFHLHFIQVYLKRKSPNSLYHVIYISNQSTNTKKNERINENTMLLLQSLQTVKFQSKTCTFTAITVWWNWRKKE